MVQVRVETTELPCDRLSPRLLICSVSHPIFRRLFAPRFLMCSLGLVSVVNL